MPTASSNGFNTRFTLFFASVITPGVVPFADSTSVVLSATTCRRPVSGEVPGCAAPR
jgi:hypothetical protein